MSSLKELRRERANARVALNAASKTLERGRHIVNAAASRLQGLQQRVADAEAVEAENIADWIASDAPGGHVTAVTNSDLEVELGTSRADLAIKSKAIASLEDTVARAAAALKTTQTAVVTAVDALFREEDVEEARQVTCLMDETAQRSQQILHFAVANELNGWRAPPEITELLERLDFPLIDRRTIAVNLAKFGDQTAANRRFAKRAALIAGDTAEEGTAEA